MMLQVAVCVAAILGICSSEVLDGDFAWGWNADADSNARYLPQQQDHFDEGNTATWTQAYFMNQDHWAGPDSDAPIFVYIGGEGSGLSSRSVTQNFVVDWLPATQGLLFGLEHRYYGCHNASSCPTDASSPDYTFLSSRQALEDLAVFHRWATKEYNIPETARWVAIGGSYPGMLAAFARALYPELFHSAVASSAPVIAKYNWDYFGFSSLAYKVQAESVNGSEACYDAVATGHVEVARLMAEEQGRERLAELFPHSVKSASWLAEPENQLDFAGNGVASFPSQGNNPLCTRPACGITQICELMLDPSLGTPLERLAHVKAAQVGESADNGWLGWITAWDYQKCTEFAFFHTCEKGSNCFFVQGLNSLNDPPSGRRPDDMCAERFGISRSETHAAVNNSNSFYGSAIAAATRIIWPNGDVDPWHGLSHLTSPGVDQPVIFPVRGAHHCAWMSSARETDQASVKEARSQIFSQLQHWLSTPTQLLA